MQLNPIDVLIVSKNSLGVIKHYAVFLGPDEFGNEWISENDKHVGVRLISKEAFFQKNSKILEVIPFKGSNEEREAALKRALDELGQPYRLLFFNCEHYANKVQTNQSSSSQVQAFTRGAVVVGGLLLIVKLLGSGKNGNA